MQKTNRFGEHFKIKIIGNYLIVADKNSKDSQLCLSQTFRVSNLTSLIWVDGTFAYLEESLIIIAGDICCLISTFESQKPIKWP